MGNWETHLPVFDFEVGNLRLQREAEAILAIKVSSSTPACVGPDIVDVAPARGAFTTFEPTQMVPGYNLPVRTGHMGRSALRIDDAFDLMTKQARRQKAAAPFTAGQVSAGRDYRSLVERLNAAGVRCTSLQSQVQSSSTAGTYSDAVLADGRRLAGLRRRIGSGVAIEIRRIRSTIGRLGARRAIPNRKVVDLVCLEEMTLTHVLKDSGWVTSTDNRRAIRAALVDALDRMQGFR